ncbi:hybrid sensor histidine kinase/response regulator [Pseudobacteriovorax antillogorgiicola]|uniref:histidine kinase n=1 Tax=Pseudobacteriovorax antillogorgiicola TaxID=1513793 RepID=A0A1Y6CEB7_9BACT|nr:ATP-binding protein [Pseudobacteriovorax antillogorgiicola]TCS47989.1 signal transduction histidine kinase [Pseudobacteriovorax antillogorgiicola]SMF58293.1 Signal transduction histidine kinase [Pseudobacteriovorax antillogorgiicola]
MNRFRDNVIKRWLPLEQLAAFLTLILGGAVILGWHLESRSLIQVSSQFVPMQYNTALGFTLLSIGLVLHSKFRTVGLLTGLCLAALALMTIAQYLWSQDFGIDQMFMNHYITTKTSYPGRMAPNTAMCFAIMSVLLLVQSCYPNRKKRVPLKSTLSTIVMFLAAPPFLGYLMSVDPVFGWQKYTNMAIHTSSGFLVLSLAHSIGNLRRIDLRQSSRVAIALGWAVFLSFYLFGLQFAESEQKKLGAFLERSADASLSKFDVTMAQSLLAFQRQSERLGRRGVESLESWMADAKDYVLDFQELEAIYLLDDTGEILASFPKGRGFTKSLSFDSYNRPGARLVVTADETSVAALATVFDQRSGRKYHLLYKINPEKLFQDLSKSSRSEDRNFALTVRNHRDHIIYQEPRLQNAQSPLYLSTFRQYQRDEVRWSLYFSASPALMAEIDTNYPELVIFLGAIIGFLSSLAYASTMRTRHLLQLSEIRGKKLEVAIEEKSRFLANISHEIRTPLNAIIGMADIIFSEVKDPILQKQLASIQSSGDLLLAIINDVLDLSKIEAGKLSLENIPFSIDVLLEEVLQALGPKASNNGTILSTNGESLGWTNGDPYRLKQVLFNLVGNAIKFCQEGQVVMSYHEEIRNDQRWVCLAITDNGIGIAPEKLPKIFAAFSQSDELSTRAFGGTGLGLAISQAIVKQWGGYIHVQSVLKVGTTFTVNLPAPKIDPPQSRLIDRSGVGVYSELEILVVDDNELNREIFTKYLAKLGLDADQAKNGHEALVKVKQKNYDLILMDCHMPEMDGFEATRRIKENLGESAPFIIALTASAMKEDREKCADAGMDDFLGKPLKHKVLKEKLLELYGPESLTKTG